MAVQATPLGSELVIRVETGVNARGATIYARRRFDDIKPEVSNDDVYAVGQSLASLQTRTVAGMQRVDTVELEEV